jgi:hypothetical protein
MVVVVSAGKINASAATVRRLICFMEVTPSEIQNWLIVNARAAVWLPSRAVAATRLHLRMNVCSDPTRPELNLKTWIE